MLGDDDTLIDLKARVKQYDVAAWWALSSKAKMPLQVQLEALHQPSPPSSSSPTASSDRAPDKPGPGSSHLHNAYAGVPVTHHPSPRISCGCVNLQVRANRRRTQYAWQLTETVDDFLARLPPSRTAQTPDTPWIYICNPYIATARPRWPVRACEDEGPLPARGAPDLATFCEGGTERLHLASSFIDHCRASAAVAGGVSRSAVARECAEAGADAGTEILALARALGVRSGKVRQTQK